MSPCKSHSKILPESVSLELFAFFLRQEMIPFRRGVICREGGRGAQFEVWDAGGSRTVAVLGGAVDLEDQQVLKERIALR